MEFGYTFCIYSLPVFLYIKPPDESTLAELLPDDHVWTEGIGGKKNLYMAGCLKLKKSTDALYALQKHFVEILFNNEDHESGCTPTSLRVFSFKMRQYVLENCLEHRVCFDLTKKHSKNKSYNLFFLAIGGFSQQQPRNATTGSRTRVHLHRVGRAQRQLQQTPRGRRWRRLCATPTVLRRNIVLQFLRETGRSGVTLEQGVQSRAARSHRRRRRGGCDGWCRGETHCANGYL